MIAIYQATAISTDKINNCPILLRGKLISSAACGITSNPTNMNGVIMTTVSKPTVPFSNNGSIFCIVPVAVLPVINNKQIGRASCRERAERKGVEGYGKG